MSTIYLNDYSRCKFKLLNHPAMVCRIHTDSCLLRDPAGPSSRIRKFDKFVRPMGNDEASKSLTNTSRKYSLYFLRLSSPHYVMQ